MNIEVFERWAFTAFVSFCVSFVMFLVVSVVAISSEGKVDYCYVTSNIPSSGSFAYYLKGHVPWRPDTIIGQYSNTKELSEAMQLLCPNERK